MAEDQETPGKVVEESSSQQQQKSTDEQAQSTDIDIEAIKRQAAAEVSSQFMSALGEYRGQNEELRRQLAERQSNSRVEEVSEISGAEFLEAPKKHIRSEVEEVVARQLKTQLEPMQNFVVNLQRQNTVESVKRQLSSASDFQRSVIETYGDVLDHVISQNTDARTPQAIAALVQNTVYMIPGLVQSGQLAARGPVNTKDKNLPANISPSAPAPPRREAAVKAPELSDIEKRIADRMGKSYAEFARLRDASADVSSWGKKEEAK